MDQYSQEELDSAKKILDFYVDLVENNKSNVKFHLSENVVLDWFGRTVKDNKKVSYFIQEQVCKVTHHMTNAYPSENVAFKESHHVKMPNSDKNLIFIPSPPMKTITTPIKNNVPSTSNKEMGQGDGIHNCTHLTPPKKMKFSTLEENNETVEGENEISQLKYITSEGSVEFHKPSVKKLQTETRWRRPVKLHLGFTTSSLKDCTIYLIIYEGNLKCRRNLFKEFCESSKSAKTSV